MILFLNELVNGIIQVILFALIPFIIWLVKYRKTESFFHWIGLRKIKHSDMKRILKWSILVFVIAYASGQVAILIRGDVQAADSAYKGMEFTAVPTALIYSFIQTALSEEILFRGFILKRLSEKFGFTAGNILQGIIFGALHLIMVWGQVGLLAGAAIFIYPIIAAMLLGYLNEKVASGSIYPSWIVHGLMNTVSQLMQVL